MAVKKVRVVHSWRQRLLGMLGLCAFFMCGAFVGGAFNPKPVEKTTVFKEHVSIDFEDAYNGEDIAEVVFKSVPVGHAVHSLINLTADGAATIIDVSLDFENKPKISLTNDGDSCKKGMKIDKETNCFVGVNYLPQKEELEKGVLTIGWTNGEEEYFAHIPVVVSAIETRTCKKIENVLQREISASDNKRWFEYIDDAKDFANLSERGCPENSKEYAQQAAQQLAIARALLDDEFRGCDVEFFTMISVYKRIGMGDIAEEVSEKIMKKIGQDQQCADALRRALSE